MRPTSLLGCGHLAPWRKEDGPWHLGGAWPKIKRHLWGDMLPGRSFSIRLLALGFLLAFCAGEFRGQSGLDGDARWEFGGCAGFLAPHRAAMRALVTSHAYGASLAWTTAAKGQWRKSRNAPRWGCVLHAGQTGAARHVGHQVAALGLAELRLAGAWRFRIGGGLGWTEKPWSDASPDTRQRVVIGSSINGAMQIGLHRPAGTSGDLWHQRVGLHLTLDHQSNASFTQPNLGTNVFRFGLSTGWNSGRRPTRVARDTSAVDSALPPRAARWQVQWGLGRRQPAPLDARETTAEVAVDRRLGRNRRGGFLVGGMGMLRPGHAGLGFHAGFQLRFTRVHVDLVHGRYAVKWQAEEAHYNRVVFQWQLKAAWWCRIALHTHGFRAHHPSLGLGYVLGGPIADRSR